MKLIDVIIGMTVAGVILVLTAIISEAESAHIIGNTGVTLACVGMMSLTAYRIRKENE